MHGKNAIGFKIRLIHNQIHKIMEAKRRENLDGLTGMQRWIIGFLIEHDGEDIYQRDIELAFSVSRATASNMLSVMERRGFIAREPVASDARLKKLVVLEKARKMREQADRDVEEMEARLVRGMRGEEIEVLVRALDQMLANLDVDPACMEPGPPGEPWRRKQGHGNPAQTEAGGQLPGEPQ